MTTHHVETDRSYFNAIIGGIKPFEVRRNDCGYQAGDYLVMAEHVEGRRIHDGHSRNLHWSDESTSYRCPDCRDRRYLAARITYVYAGDPRWSDLEHGYVVLGLADIDRSLPINGGRPE